MAAAGAIVTNAVNGECIVLTKTADETRGALLQYETYVDPDGGERDAHAHPRQEERVTIVKGNAHFQVGEVEHILHTGEMVVIRPGTVHSFANAGERPLHLATELRPALFSDELLEKVDRLSKQGKLGRNPVSNLLQTSILIERFPDEFAYVGWKRYALKALAPVARRLGYRSYYSEN
jgi:quercetin dioxygenase-like cupin family protein